MCPRCGSMRVHHSRPRTAAERLTMRLVPLAYHRCHDCGWRNWRSLRSLNAAGAYAQRLLTFLTIFAIGASLIALGLYLMR